MRLTRKLTLSLVLGIMLVMTANAVFHVRREQKLFDADSRSDERAVGNVLLAAIEAVWLAEGEIAARRLIAEVDRRRHHLTVRWVSLAPGAPAADAPLAAPEALGRIAAGRTIVTRARAPSGDERRITYMPLIIQGEHRGALEISESLQPERRFSRATTLQVAVATLTMLVLCALIATGTGLWFVGRPIQALRDKARRVGAGDLSGPLEVRQRDEIGELATELNAMCERLAESGRRVTIATEARIAALEQLRHADRLKTVGQLASGMAHELGTPLNVIAGRAKMISQGVAQGDAAADGARIIVEQAARITAIIRQLLDFSRRRGPSLGPHDLRAIAARTAELLGPLARKRDVTLTVESPEGALPAQVDPVQLQQVLSNLVMNGLHAMPEGGRLTIRLDRCRATPPPDVGGPPGEYAAISVQDEGGGIPEEDLPHLFEPFFTTRSVGEGTGLGLSVAYGIVRDHGGWIDVESRPGRGSRFTIRLQPNCDSSSRKAYA